MTDLNGQGTATTPYTADDRQTPSKFSNGIGGILKRFTPKYRSRSKSPAAHSHQRVEKSWVTVEIKDCQKSPSTVSGHGGMGNYIPATTSSSSSPSSPILRNGSTSPDKSPRLRGAWGNLFHRGSMKKPRELSSAQKAAKIEVRTRSEHELAGNGVDVGGIRMACTQSADLAGGRFRPAVVTTMTQRLAMENGGDIRDGMGGASSASAATRGTLSEEDLVSKSLSQERGDVYKSIFPRGIATSGGVQSSVPATLLTSSTAYHSQDSVFDSPGRIPSYVRISCTLSGYRNYRNVDLKTAQSPKRPSAKFVETTTDGQRASNSASSSTETAQIQPAVAAPLPVGKSIVERRLEKFEGQSNRQTSVVAEVTSPKEQPSVAADGVAATPTPIRNLISSFNKMSIHDGNTPLVSRPRQKPPPVPPKREPSLDVDQETPPIFSLARENELTVQLEPVDTSDSHSGGSSSSKTGVFAQMEMENALEQQAPVQNGEHSSGDTNLTVPSDSIPAERIVNGAFYLQPAEENATTTLAQRAVDVAVEEAFKDVAAASFVQHPRECDDAVASFNDQEMVSVEGISTGQPPVDVLKLDFASTGLMDVTTATDGGGDIAGDGAKMTVDGFYYEREAIRERARLENLCSEAEEDLNKEYIPDEAAESLRMAIGRVRLLLRKKFAMFEELIKNNLQPKPDDPRPTLVSDLEGYYDLVKMEIGDIDACFDVVRRLKANNWQPVASPDSEGDNEPQPVKREQATKSKPRQSKQGDKRTSAIARSEAARQRLKEAKEAALQRKKLAETVEEATFIPDEPGNPS